jgi:hypothetical protein
VGGDDDPANGVGYNGDNDNWRLAGWLAIFL